MLIQERVQNVVGIFKNNGKERNGWINNLTCPFCDKRGKFGIQIETGFYHCNNAFCGSNGIKSDRLLRLEQQLNIYFIK